MKKIDKHEPYCGCINCKPIDTSGGESVDFWAREHERQIYTDPSDADTGEWPALKLEPDTRPTPQGEGGCA